MGLNRGWLGEGGAGECQVEGAAIEETLELLREGKVFERRGSTSLKNFKTLLPAAAKDVNLSTSICSILVRDCIELWSA